MIKNSVTYKPYLISIYTTQTYLYILSKVFKSLYYS